MDILEVIKAKIADSDCDGLCNIDAECGCGVDELAPCEDGPHRDCVLAKSRTLGDDEYIGDVGPGDLCYFAKT